VSRLAHRALALGLALLVAQAPLAAAPTPAAPAAAADDDALARDHFDRGRQLAASGKYAEAYAAFEAAFAAVPRPAFAFNMGETARAMGDVVRARAAYERYLALAPAGPLAATARQRLERLPRTISDPTPPPAPRPAASTDATPARADGEAPPPRVPPPHRAVSRPTGDLADVDFTYHPPAPEGRPLWKKWPFWAAIGGVVVTGVVVGIVMTRDGGSDCGRDCLSFE
jgi:tetratricopeptide (TPR) repeat protein